MNPETATPMGIPLAFSLNPPAVPWWPAGYLEPMDLYACPTCDETAWGYLSPSCPRCFIPDAAFSHHQTHAARAADPHRLADPGDVPARRRRRGRHGGDLYAARGRPPMNPDPTRTVLVLDRAAQNAAWGRGGGGLVFRTVTLVWICPRCLGPRGEPTPRQFCEDGEFYSVSCWENPCGHVDTYPEVLREASQLAELATLEGREA